MNIRYLQGRAPDLPHRLNFLNGNKLDLQQWLRVLPDQRYVARAQWKGRTVLAKMFVGPRAQRHFQRELSGAQQLADSGLPTPHLLASDYDQAFGGWVLFDYLHDAQSLEQCWQKVAHLPLLTTEQQNILQQTLNTIARMHAQGLWQADIHLDNFMLHQGRLYVIDAGGIAVEHAGQPLSVQAALGNLAVFFAQLSPALDIHLPQLLELYSQAGAQLVIPLAALRTEISKVRQWRIRDYLKKTARDCSLFNVQKSLSGVCAIQRARLSEVSELIERPDDFIAAGHLYKTGGAATVARVEHQGRQWIIKRYNIKNFTHWLKRCWRPSRAWHSWQAGYLLQLEGVAVAQNFAVRENRFLGLRSTAWLVSEFQGDQDLIARFAPYIDNGEVPPADLQQLQSLLQAMIRAKISHGDLKGHNILWHNNRCLLIDLDAVRQHRDHASFARAFARDRARLLRNWPQTSRLYPLLNEKLPQVD